MIKEAVTDIDPTCRATLGLNLEASKPYGIKLCAGLSFGEKLEKIKSLMSVSCKDLAKILRINEATLRRWRKDESLPLVGNGERGRDTYLKKFKEGLRKRDKGKPKEWPGSLARWLFDAANEPQAPTKKTLERGWLQVTTTKNGTSRRVPLTAKAKAILEARLARHSGRYVLESPRSGRPKNAHNFYQRVFVPAVEAAQLHDVVFHDLRHTFCSRLVMAGVPLNTVRELAGHKTLEMTLRYSHLAPDHQALAIRALDG